MTRLSGIQLLAVSFVLWALAVWIFGTPAPAGNGTETAAETTARASGDTTEEPGTGANEPAGTETAAAAGPATPEHQVAATPADSEMATGGSLPRAPSERTGAAAVPTPPPAGAPAVPAAGMQPPADLDRTAETATTAPATGAETLAALPAHPGDGAGRPAPPRGTAPPRPWFEPPLSRPALPPRPGYRAADHDPVAAQLDAGRRAAWEGRFADALAHYRAAARLRPDHYVVWGEMGNVLWTMRRWPEAAYALEGAATLLVRAGELRAASELVPAVGRIDPDAAYRIQQRVWAAAQRQSG